MTLYTGYFTKHGTICVSDIASLHDYDILCLLNTGPYVLSMLDHFNFDMEYSMEHGTLPVF